MLKVWDGGDGEGFDEMKIVSEADERVEVARALDGGGRNVVEFPERIDEDAVLFIFDVEATGEEERDEIVHGVRGEKGLCAGEEALKAHFPCGQDFVGVRHAAVREGDYGERRRRGRGRNI